MDKVTIRYSRNRYLGMLSVLVLCIPLYLLLVVLFDYSGSTLVVLVSVIGLILELATWLGAETKIILTDEGLTIGNPLKSNKFLWNEISEFGKYRQRFNRYNSDWVYYIKSSNYSDKKFILGSRGLININKMCLIIFEKASKARFVVLQMDSVIPFVGNREAVTWERDKDGKENYF